MSDTPERCPVHNVFHPKGPLCDPTQTDTANPWVEAVLESMDDIRVTEVSVVPEPPHEEWKIIRVNPVTNIPVTYNGEVVGTASVDENGVLKAELNSPMGNKLKDLVLDGVLDHISVDSSIEPSKPLKYDLRAPHSRACGYKSHAHGPECSDNCPTCHGK